MPRVDFISSGVTGINLDWDELVFTPIKEKRYIEAFASADALIDESIESILRQVYSDSASQRLINQLHALKGRVNFDGMTIMAILKNMKIIDRKFYQRIIEFKKSRNLVLHTTEGEYKLVESELAKVKTQGELDDLASKRAREILSEAFTVFNDLHDLSHRIGSK